jgi:putative inorganic carbon (HCO3(-)) transporter
MSLVLSPFRHASFLELWRVALVAGLYFLGLQLAGDENRRKWIARSIAATAGLVAAYGILQRLGLDPMSWGANPVSGRSFSTCGHPNFLAAYLAISLPVTGALFLAARSRKARALWGLDVGLQILCLYFTFSRGGWLGGLGAAGIFIFLAGWPSRFRGFFLSKARKGWVLAGIVAIALVVGVGISSHYNPFTSKAASMSIDTRVQIYKGGLGMFGARPVVGHGIGTFPTVFPRFRPLKYREIDPRPNVMHAHCEYLMILDEMGVVGLGVFVWFVFTVAWSGFAAIRERDPGPDRLMLIGLFAGVTGLLVHGTFCVVLRTSIPELHLWLILGILAALPADTKARKVALGRRIGIPLAVVCFIGTATLLYYMSFRPFSSNAVEREAGELKQQGRWADAVLAYERATKLDPWNLEARYERAVCLVELECYADALEAYSDIAKLAPDYVHTHYNMGMIHCFTHDWGKATDEFKAAASTGSFPLRFDVDRALAIIDSETSDEDRELAIFEMVVKGRFLMGAQLRGVEENTLSQEVAAKGTEYYLAGRLGRAGVLFRHALSLKPDDRAVLNNLAGIYFQRKEYDEAIRLCERLLEINPADAHVATNLGKAWLLKGDKGKAVEILDSVLSRKPDYREALDLLRKIRRTRRRSR